MIISRHDGAKLLDSLTVTLWYSSSWPWNIEIEIPVLDFGWFWYTIQKWVSFSMHIGYSEKLSGYWGPFFVPCIGHGLCTWLASNPQCWTSWMVPKGWANRDVPSGKLTYTDGPKVRMTCFPPKFFHWKLEWRTKMDVEILLKFYLSVRIMLVNVDKNVQKLFDQTCLPVVPGPPNLYLFVGLECLRSICPQNIWILYRC